MKKRLAASIFPRLLLWTLTTGIIGLFSLVWVTTSAASDLRQASGNEGTPTPAADSAPTPLPGIPIELNGEIIFYVMNGIDDLTAMERAIQIENQINDLATNPFHSDTDIILVESSDGTELLAGYTYIMTVTDEDAESYGMTRHEVAQMTADKIQTGIDLSRQLQSIGLRIIQILFSLGILLGLAIAYFILKRLADFFNRKIDSISTQGLGKGIVRQTQYFRSGSWKLILKKVVNIFKWILFIAFAITAVSRILTLFPETANLAETILLILTAPLRLTWSWFVSNINNFVTLAIIAVIFYTFNRISVIFFNEIEQGNIKLPGFEPEWSFFTQRIITFLLIAGAFIVAFPYIPGSDSEAFRGVTVFLGALVTLTTSSAISNIVAGIIQTYTGAFRIGDVVKIGDVTGVVLEKQLITTRVLTFKNEEVSIPNDAVLKNNVVNYSTMTQDSRLVLYTTITIGYDVPWQEVHKLLIAAAKSTPDILEEPAPFILQKSLNDYHISYELNCHTNNPERMPRIYSQLHTNILDEFTKAGVEIMSPAFTALRDGNKVNIPKINQDILEK